MSQSTKRKHVAKEVLNEFEIPKDNQKIVRLVGGRGNNLHQVRIILTLMQCI
jgi:probable RNA-binding protein EIF1AD